MGSAVALLEQEPHAVADNLAAAGARYNYEVPVRAFDELLVSAMNSGMDYWAGLAVRWAEQMPTGAPVARAAAELITQSWASQKVSPAASAEARSKLS